MNRLPTPETVTPMAAPTPLECCGALPAAPAVVVDQPASLNSATATSQVSAAAPPPKPAHRGLAWLCCLLRKLDEQG